MKPENYVEIQRDGNLRGDNSVFFRYATAHGRAVADYAARSKSKTLLDVGCRYGHSLVAAKENNPALKVTGVDIVPEFVKASNSIGLDAVVGDACELPFKDKSFDWVICNHTLEHTHDTPKAVSELKRVSKNGLYVVVPLEHESPDNISHFFTAPYPATWRSLFDDDEWVLMTQICSGRPDVTLVYVTKETQQELLYGEKR